ncbi:MAG: ATP-binding protein, partial [Rudaea sp.]
EWQILPAFAGISLVILAAVTGVVFLFARYITAPVRELARASREMSAGNLESPVTVRRDDEIGELAEAFRAMQQDLAASRRALEAEKLRYAELNDLKEQMLANVPHELKTPLAAIAASMEMLRQYEATLTPEERTRLLDSLHRSVVRLQFLIDNMLDAASIQAGRFRIQPEPVSILAMIEEARLFLQPLLHQKGQSLNVIASGNGARVCADPQRVEQVLINLISNANKYGDANSAIQVETQRGQDYMCVQIRNGGAPVPPEVQRSIFDRFARNPLTAQVNGSGLGLAIARTIVEMHNGEIELTSSAENGTTVRFTLPLHKEEFDEDPDRR